MSCFSRFRTGLSVPAVTVALTPARSASSRLRRRYEERYRGRYRFSSLVFAIDIAVVLAVVMIFGVGVWLAMRQAAPEVGLKLVFSAPPIVTATNIAFEAKVSVQDGQTHPNVRLRWVLPRGASIVSSSPGVDNYQEALLGDLGPGEERLARLALRLMIPPGSVRIGFEVRSGDELWSGQELRPVVGSALHLEEKIAPLSATYNERLLVLENVGNATLDCARVTIDGEPGLTWDVKTVGSGWRQGSLGFDELVPHARRIFSVKNLRSLSASVWCRDVELERVVLTPSLFMTTTSTVVMAVPASTPGQETVLAVTSTETLAILVYHPLLREAERGFRVFAVPVGTTHVSLPLTFEHKLERHGDLRPFWLAWPLRRTPQGYEALGRIQSAAITTPFGLKAEARYYAASGSQIGVGPLPPRVGEPTRYWVQWRLNPVETDVSNLEIHATLPQGVTWTGQSALPKGGELAQEGQELVWRIPFLPSSPESTDGAFEVVLTPSADMQGSVPSLLETSRARAREVISGSSLQAQTGSIDTSLSTDERARGKGVVR